jgi:hypothetical protein
MITANLEEKSNLLEELGKSDNESDEDSDQ